MDHSTQLSQQTQKRRTGLSQQHGLWVLPPPISLRQPLCLKQSPWGGRPGHQSLGHRLDLPSRSPSDALSFPFCSHTVCPAGAFPPLLGPRHSPSSLLVVTKKTSLSFRVETLDLGEVCIQLTHSPGDRCQLSVHLLCLIQWPL